MSIHRNSIHDDPPSPERLRELIWNNVRPDEAATKDQRALGYLAMAILYLVEEK